jgi:hypothetical protein
MKKIITLVTIGALFFQCGNNAQAPALPGLTAVVDGANYGQVKTNLTITAPAGFKSLQIHKVLNDVPQLVTEIYAGDKTYDGKVEFEFPFTYELTKEDAGEHFFFQAIIIDKEGRKSPEIKLVDVTGRIPATFFYAAPYHHASRMRAGKDKVLSPG